MTKVCILGATGSIGRQALDVCRQAGYAVSGVTAGSDHAGLLEICRDYGVPRAALHNKEAYDAFIREKSSAKAYGGIEGILECIRDCGADIVVNGIVGSAGILPTLEAIRSSGRLALANKETLVAAGSLVMDMARAHDCMIIPVDSEHSAIFQCLADNGRKYLSRIYLTASGGPFRGYSIDQLKHVTKEMALQHPSWVMGSKITIDSATLMNKGLEVIEARWLFGMAYDEITVVVHPGSIVHSMVEFRDNSILAQLGAPDMRIPLQYALTYPERKCNNYKKLDIYKTGGLIFEEPDTDAFRCLALAYEAGRAGGTMPCVMNAANEEAVGMFLEGSIGFTDIPEIIERVMDAHEPIEADGIEAILEADSAARAAARNGGRI
ncbi:MAG: 1-deoxy-D-xylulose-5-phosphate reductoisomerase [Clostridia bacterium]|nr:1-deoxy-D-xylulose-5-phosphate reductoisomerase [Clostridia bacterium]